MLVLFGTILAVLVLGMTSMITNSHQLGQIIEGLRNVTIMPTQNLTFGLEDPITLTAQGDFGIRTIPIKARWMYRRASETTADPTSIANCSNVTSCTFSFRNADDAGTYRIFAEASGYRATATMVIEE